VGGNQDDAANLLRSINLDIANWEQQRDAKAIGKLDGILSPQILFRRADKTVVGKKEFMDALLGPSPFATRVSSNVIVTLRDDRAVCTLIVTTAQKDGPVSHYRNIRWFARREDRWLMEYWFNDDIIDLADIAAAYE
jgi:Domain of unknown function (DUF4440)